MQRASPNMLSSVLRYIFWKRVNINTHKPNFLKSLFRIVLIFSFSQISEAIKSESEQFDYRGRYRHLHLGHTVWYEHRYCQPKCYAKHLSGKYMMSGYLYLVSWPVLQRPLRTIWLSWAVSSFRPRSRIIWLSWAASSFTHHVSSCVMQYD